MEVSLGGETSKIFLLSSLFGEDEPILKKTHCAKGLVQPPTRRSLVVVL